MEFLILLVLIFFFLLAYKKDEGSRDEIQKKKLRSDSRNKPRSKKKNKNADEDQIPVPTNLKQISTESEVSQVENTVSLKFTKAAAIAQRVAKNADVDSVIKFAHLMRSDAERNEVVLEINEELKPLYVTEIFTALEIDAKDHIHYRQLPSFSNELDRCMELGIRQILSDQRLVEALGAGLFSIATSNRIEKKKSWQELKDEL
jgi:hypothetical protein